MLTKISSYTLPSIFILLSLIISFSAQAEDIQRHGNAYVVYLSADLDFNDVVDGLESAIAGENWRVIDMLDIGSATRQFGMNTEHKVISACKTQYLARAVQEDPYVSLIIPCRFTVFREPATEGKGRIVLGLSDPVAEAKGLEVKQIEAAVQASKELKAVLQHTAEMFEE